MDLIKLIDKIENECYLDDYKKAIPEVQNLIDEIYNSYTADNSLLSVLKVLLSAMEKEDNILIGDCLEYGIKPYFSKRAYNSVFDDDLTDLPDIGLNIYYYASFSDEPVLCVRDEDGTMNRLNSLFSPIHEVDTWLSNMNVKMKTPAVCLFGIGTGLFAESLLKRLPEDSRLFLYEPNHDIINFCLDSASKNDADDVEKRIANRINKILNDKRVSLFVESDDDLLFRTKLEDDFDYVIMTGLIVAKHNNYDRIFPKSCLKFYKEINNYRAKVITNRNTLAHFKENIVANSFRNLYYFLNANLCDEIDTILPDDIPVIIVSAGPSLDKNIDLLSQVKGHCLIFAVDTAVRYLLKKDILPDLTITIDSKKPANYFADERAHEIPCIFDVTSNTDILKNHKGRVFIFNNSDFYMGRLFEAAGKKLTMVPNGGSVATAAFALMYVLKQKKIILIGQDLASSNGATHAGGVDDKTNYEESLVEGYYGGMVTTRSDWLGYLRWFENSIETIKKTDDYYQIIDATEGGAKIHGAEQMTLQEAIDSCKNDDKVLPDYNFEQELSKLDYSIKENDFKNLLNKHKESVKKLKDIYNNADEAVRICEKLIKGIEQGTVSASYVDKEKKKITQLIRQCSKTTIFPLLNDYLITDVVDEISRLRYGEGDIKTVELNGINLMKISFEAISESARIVLENAREIDDEMGKRFE